MHSPVRLDSRFWRLWSAVAISYTGDGMVLVAFPLLAVSVTRSALLIAAVTVAARVAAFLGALPAGVLADRYDRRRLLLVTELVRFGILAVFGGLILWRPPNLPEIYAITFLLGGLAVLFECVSTAMLPAMVPPSLLVKGNAYLNAVDITSQDLLGQSLGGFAFGLSKAVPFFSDAASFVGSAALIAGSVPSASRESTGTDASRPSVLNELSEGFRWFRSHGIVRLASYFNACMAFCQALILGLVVLYATTSLHLSNAGYGLLLGISGIGNIVGAAAAHRLHVRYGTGFCVLTAGLVSAAAYPILALTHSPITACAALTLETMAVTVGSVALRSLRQANIPDELQGRVGSVHMTLVLGAFPAGALIGGLVASRFGVRVTMITAGVLQLGMVALVAPRLLVLIGKVRRQGPPDPEP